MITQDDYNTFSLISKDDYCIIDHVPHQILHVIAMLILRLIKQKQKNKTLPYI